MGSCNSHQNNEILYSVPIEDTPCCIYRNGKFPNELITSPSNIKTL